MTDDFSKLIPHFSLGIERLDLSLRAYNCLKRAKINTIGELVENYYHLRDFRNLGVKTEEEIQSKLKEFNPG